MTPITHAVLSLTHMRFILGKAVAVLSVAILIVGAQCAAFCSTAQCSGPVKSERPTSGHCKRHGSHSFNQNQGSRNQGQKPECPQQEQSLATNGMDTGIRPVLLAWTSAASPVAASLEPPLPKMRRVKDRGALPPLPVSLSTKVLRV